MSTRGFVGFRWGGKDYRTKVRYDAYPESLGATTVELIQDAIQENALDDWRKKVDSLVLVDYDTPPTQADRVKLDEHRATLNVENPPSDDDDSWYDLLWYTQGRVDRILDCGYLYTDLSSVMGLEYGYVVNLDDECLDFFPKGEFGDDLQQFPFDDLPLQWLEPQDQPRDADQRMVEAVRRWLSKAGYTNPDE
mmetsp:Transcript_44/g.127  ORF Transcript_44/g.127 Transcript_44/m.127 type:complete len:193 (+) Transcript_44:85-663(+)